MYFRISSAVLPAGNWLSKMSKYSISAKLRERLKGESNQTVRRPANERHPRPASQSGGPLRTLPPLQEPPGVRHGGGKLQNDKEAVGYRTTWRRYSRLQNDMEEVGYKTTWRR